jgi:hypothetical protein
VEQSERYNVWMRLHGPYAFVGLIVAIVVLYLILRLTGILPG